MGAFFYGHVSHNLDPFSETLGLEKLTPTQLADVVGYYPEGWDILDEETRRDLLIAGEGSPENTHEGQSEIVALADRIPRTIAFTVLALGQIFSVMAIHAGDKRSFFRVWFTHNHFMLWAVISTFVLQLAVIYVPFLQFTFETYPLRIAELIGTLAIASLMLFGTEIEKWLLNRRAPQAA